MLKGFLPALAIFAIAWAALGATPTPPATPTKPHKRQHRSTPSASHTAAKGSTQATAAKSTKAPADKTTEPTTAQAKPKTAQAKTRGAKTTKAKITKVAAHGKGKPPRRPSRSYQQAPTPGRYKEIQQALTSKGYLQGEPTGEWGTGSVDALKRFQTDQSLMPDGKINSLSLIALGLGPKRLTAKSDPVPPQPGTPAPASPLPPQ
jgi:hypothetical protein